MDELAVMIYTRWLILKSCLKDGAHDFLTDEQGDVNIVSIVVLIGIAVLLAILFREQIEKLLETLFSTISGNASDAIAK